MVLAALVALAWQEVTVSYDPFGGLQVKVGGVPFIQGSGFQYFSVKDGSGIYSSRWSPKEVTRLPDGTIRVRYSGVNGDAIGTHDFSVRADGLTARYQFRWRGKDDVWIEDNIAQVWAPSVSHGQMLSDGLQTLPFDRPIHGDWSSRRTAGPAQQIRFDSALLSATAQVRGAKISVYDARDYSAEWARTACLFWMGFERVKLTPGTTLDVTVDWKIQPKVQPAGNRRSVVLQGTEHAAVLQSAQDGIPIVPKPKLVTESGGFLDIVRETDQDQAPPDSVTQAIARRFRVDASSIRFPLRQSTGPQGLPPEGYRLVVTPDGVEAKGQDPAGLRHALDMIPKLARIRNGRLVLPCGIVRDWPTVAWRGVHLFAGPQAASFQSDLAEHLLGPLGFNKVVVECERTQWDALSAPRRDFTSKAELSDIFEGYRRAGLEPIPLIESLGHMDWLLDGAFNALAIDPQTPYILDARRGQARELLARVWKEAIDLLHPSAVHFGLDETDKRGMKDDPTLATRLWDWQVPNLVGLAQASRVTPMVWGDMILSPGQAPDATHAANVADAAHRAAKLPRGTFVCDWHYLSTDDPDRFTSLSRFKSLGLVPIASSWWQPRNIRSHTLAAIREKTGTLQTTWAGYSTDEAAMIQSPEQFAAYVTAADFTWSGRTDPVAKLPYDPLDVLRKLMFGPRAALTDLPGACWSTIGSSRVDRLNGVLFNTMEPLALNTPLTSAGSQGASSLILKLATKASELALALDCVSWEPEGTPVADVQLVFSDGTILDRALRYGGEVRVPEDGRPDLECERAGTVSILRLPIGSGRGNLEEIRIQPLSRTAGLRVLGVSTF